MATIAKRIQSADLTNLKVPTMSAADWQDFERGIALFNDEKYWDSHEAWEEVWKRHHENSRIFFQGLIQVAAALVQLKRGVYHGADKHCKNALWKLRPFRPSFLGIDVTLLVDGVLTDHRELQRLGKDNLHKFDPALLPKIRKVI